jgi:predicted 3-demethylubiquinone-9 3-methyltransferase (glyoxalase superfamily)
MEVLISSSPTVPRFPSTAKPKRRSTGIGKSSAQAVNPGPCGWLKDKFGLYWQINPKILDEMLNDPDPEKAKRVMQAMLKMSKISIENLRRAYQGN